MSITSTLADGMDEARRKTREERLVRALEALGESQEGLADVLENIGARLESIESTLGAIREETHNLWLSQ